MASMTSCCASTVDRKQWNKIIKDQVVGGNSLEAIISYREMLENGCHHGDNYTFPILLKASSNLSCVYTGAVLHAQAIKTGFCKHGFVQTALVNFYSAMVHVDDAFKVFNEMSTKDVVTWNSMLDAYASVGQMDKAASVFDSMPVKDQISFNIMISGYANSGNVKSAKQIFGTMNEEQDVVSWNSMIKAYVKIREIGMALELFHQMPNKNLVSWNTMLGGYLQIELYQDVIDLFKEFIISSGQLEPNHITLTTVSSACAHIGALDVGIRLHIYAMMNTGAAAGRLTLNPRLVSSLMDMYAKCGRIERALELFHKLEAKDIYCWNVIISGLAVHGNAPAALSLFEDMKTKGFTPDSITFIGVLSACSHAGLVEEGLHLFESMDKDFGVSAKSEHYGCMVDLLCRAGFLQSAIKLIGSMPFEPGKSVLGALLSGCIMHQDTETGKMVAKRIITAAGCLGDGEYIMISNLYVLCGRWDEANKWRARMGEIGIHKTAGYSSVEVNGRMYKFLAGEMK